MSIKKASFTLTGMVSLILSGAVQAKAADETVVVTASGFNQTVQNAPASISVISRKDLEAHYYRDATDALRSVPGVIVSGGSGKTSISMRGMSSAYTLLMVDGKRQSSRQTRPNSDGPGIEAGWLPPLEAIERIEVIRGPMSTLYGSDAIGGVINIITRKNSQKWHGKVQLSTVLQENHDSGNETSSNFFVGGPLTDALSMQLYGQYTDRDEDDIEEGFADKQLKNITGKFTYRMNDYHDLTLEAGISEQERASHIGKSASSSHCRGKCSDSENEYRRDHVALTHHGSWGIGDSKTYIEYEDTNNKSREMRLDNTVFNSSLIMPFEQHSLTLGTEIKHEHLDDQGNQSSSSDLSSMSKTQWAIFAEDEWRIVESFRLTLGARLDHDDNFGSHVSPRAYGAWNINPTWTFKGGVSTGFHAPQLREITEEWVQVSRGGNVYGNSGLEPETSVNTEVALQYHQDQGLDASVTFFHNDFKDKISRVACPASVCTDGKNQFGSDPTYRINIDKAETYGSEVSASYPITEQLELSANYTYTHSEQKSGEAKGEPLVQLPKHMLSADANWQATEQWLSWAKVTYRGKEMRDDSARDPDPAEAYTFVDVGVNYALNEHVTLKAAVYNAFDKDITVEEYGYVEDGRRYWLGTDIQF
ncbi:MAG: ligand-gated channel protein [Vibrio sp.]